MVARLADASNFGGKPHEWQHKAEILQQHCKDVGRDYDEIQKTISGEIFVRETEAEIEAAGTKSMWGEPVESWREGNLDAAATLAMANIPRGVRAGRLCATELRLQLQYGPTAYTPEWLTSYKLDEGTVLCVRHGSFRAGGAWYNVSFECQVDPEATEVVSFAYRVGERLSPSMSSPASSPTARAAST